MRHDDVTGDVTVVMETRRFQYHHRSICFEQLFKQRGLGAEMAISRSRSVVSGD